jgi:hypothetical protein
MEINILALPQGYMTAEFINVNNLVIPHTNPRFAHCRRALFPTVLVGDIQYQHLQQIYQLHFDSYPARTAPRPSRLATALVEKFKEVATTLVQPFAILGHAHRVL